MKPGLVQTDTNSGIGHLELRLDPERNRSPTEAQASSESHMVGSSIG